MSARCSACRAPVLWVVLLPKKSRAPLDASPVVDGNVELTGRMWGDTPEARVLGKKAVAAGADLFDPRPRYVSHFVTCSRAAEFRRKIPSGVSTTVTGRV